MADPVPSQSGSNRTKTVSVSVSHWSDGWAWRVQQVDPRPLLNLGQGTAPSREQAWQDAASVINDQGEL